MQGYKFRRQRPELNYIADFMCFDLKLIIEVDGFTHTRDETYEKDRKKDRDIEDAGYQILRFTDKEVLTGIWNVARCIEQYIGEFNKLHPPRPLPTLRLRDRLPAGGDEEGNITLVP
jgi:very-short-patch-repair endonuclease